MEFKKSLIISAVLHILVIVLVPGFEFARIKTDWVEVSVVAIPDIKKRTPDWQPGRRIIPQPSRETFKADKTRFPLPAEQSDVGIPAAAESPKLPELMEKESYEPEKKEFEKVMPERKGKEGTVEELGEDRSLVITGPVMNRQVVRPCYPKYPAWAEEKGIEGEVGLKFWVSPEGMITSVELTRTSGYPDFDSRAMEAIKKYLFAPLGKDEEQKEQWGKVTISYTLK